jgi:glutamate-1-semialdehyde 2,1-aminomutase
VGGVDIAGWPGGLVSAVHSAEDVERTLGAFEATIGMLAEDGALG